MKKTLILSIFISVIQLGHCQWMIGLNGGMEQFRRDIPMAGIDLTMNGGLGLDLNYRLDSTSLQFNISSYLFPSTRSEVVSNSNQYVTDFYTPVIIMAGIGLNSDLRLFVNISTSLQLGYWYTKSGHYNQYVNQSEYFERKFSQFAIGPKINVSFGKKRLKGNLIFEHYFLSAAPGICYKTFGRERLTRLSIGTSYSF